LCRKALLRNDETPWVFDQAVGANYAKIGQQQTPVKPGPTNTIR
jgi:hypothetical protein